VGHWLHFDLGKAFSPSPGAVATAEELQVGCMMMRQVTSINWRYIGDAVPAFVTLAFVPLSYSVAYGLIAYVLFLDYSILIHPVLTIGSGLFSYTALNGLIYLTKLASRGRIMPPDADMAEYWTCKCLALPLFDMFSFQATDDAPDHIRSVC
jgi:hypothetical protein